MTKFISVQHEIEAFQFKADIEFDPPLWFLKAVENNRAQVTLSDKYGKYITVYGENQKETAIDTYWVCLSEHGKIYVLDDVRFQRYYREIMVNNENT